MRSDDRPNPSIKVVRISSLHGATYHTICPETIKDRVMAKWQGTRITGELIVPLAAFEAAAKLFLAAKAIEHLAYETAESFMLPTENYPESRIARAAHDAADETKIGTGVETKLAWARQPLLMLVGAVDDVVLTAD